MTKRAFGKRRASSPPRRSGYAFSALVAPMPVDEPEPITTMRTASPALSLAATWGSASSLYSSASGTAQSVEGSGAAADARALAPSVPKIKMMNAPTRLIGDVIRLLPPRGAPSAGRAHSLLGRGHALRPAIPGEQIGEADHDGHPGRRDQDLRGKAVVDFDQEEMPGEGQHDSGTEHVERLLATTDHGLREPPGEERVVRLDEGHR